MQISDYIAIAALLIAVLSAVYSRWTWSEAKKANDISRINTLITLREHYSELMNREFENSNRWLDGKENKIPDGYTEACSKAAAGYQEKLTQVTKQLEVLQKEVMGSDT